MKTQLVCYNSLDLSQHTQCSTNFKKYTLWLYIITQFIKIVESTGNEFSDLSPSSKKFCGHIEVRNEVGPSIILNVSEGHVIPTEQFGLIYDKIHRGSVVLHDSTCMIEICGYNDKKRFSYYDKDCYEFWENTLPLPENPYNQDYRVTHISCGCKKNRPECEKRTCSYLRFIKDIDEITSTWPEGTCGMLFEEEDCQECFHDPIFIKPGKVFETRNSAFIRSSFVPVNLCHFSVGEGLPYGYDYDSKTHKMFPHHSSKTPAYASKRQSFYYCFNCNGIRKHKVAKTGQLQINATTTELPATASTSIVTTASPIETSSKLEDQTQNIVRTRSPQEEITSNSSSYIAFSVGVILFVSIGIVICIGLRRCRKFYPTQTIMSRRRIMFEKDIRQFKNGIQLNPLSENIEMDNRNTCGSTTAWNIPYDKKYEIDRRHLVFGDVLDEGVFGIIHKGTLLTFDKHRFKNVAIKSAKDSCREYVKDIMNEIKILSYLGYHSNIVYFIGACTVDLKLGKVHYIMEFCPHGSINSYLERQRQIVHPSTHRPVVPSTTLPGYCQNEAISPRLAEKDQVLFNRMVTWSDDIASGMEFLYERKILHIDLATRNVLLGDDFTAKLADFGLSRKLYKQISYEKTGNVPIPFKWMAIESLTKNTFTVKSDVWAYGVTLWEIYDIGNQPYPDLGFKEVCTFLLSGSRLECPKYASQEIYEKIILCWEEEPDSRPDFAELKEFFRKMKNNYQTEVVDS